MPTENATSEIIRAALHAIASCGGAQMKGQSCATAAGSAAATVALNNLFKVNVKDMTEAQKLAYSNLIQTIVTGVAVGTGANGTTAQFASRNELENNQFFDGNFWFEIDRILQSIPVEGGGYKGLKWTARELWAAGQGNSPQSHGKQK